MKKLYTVLLSSAFGLCAIAGTPDLALTSLNVKETMVINHAVSISGTVANTGSEAIYSFEVTWTVGSITGSATVTGIELLPGETYDFVSVGAFVPSEARKYNMSVEVANPNGMADIHTADNKLNHDIYGLLKTAVKVAVAEEATGTWCGWCPRGAIFMEDMEEEYGDLFIPIAVHNSDPMENNTYDNAIASSISGYPAVVLDRFQTIDPSELPTKIPGRLDNDPIAEMTLFGTFDEGTSTLTVTVQAMFLSEEDEIDYRLNVVITEDDVTGTGSGYSQVNYYAGGGYGEMGGYEDLPSTVNYSNMVYDFVAREIVDDWEGTEESVPTSVAAGEYVTYTYEIDIDEDWDQEFISIIGLLTDHDDDDEIINAVSVRLSDLNSTGVSDVANTYDIDVYPNPAQADAFVRIDLIAPQELSMRITDMNGKVVAEKNYGTNTGDIAMPINTSVFSSGLYLINVIAGDQMITEKLHITH